MSKQFGYARVSSTDQDLTVQREALVAAGVPEALIFAEKASGTKTEGRPELARVLAILSSGDVLIVTRIDRLARSMKDFVTIVSDLKARGIGFRCTEQAIDTTGAAGALTMHILAACAEFETQLRRERQLEGIARVKRDAPEKYAGRKPSVDRSKVHELKAAGKGPTEIARELGCNPSTVHRLLAA